MVVLNIFDTDWTSVASNAIYLLVEVPLLLGAFALPCVVVLGLPIHALLARVGYPRSLGYIFGGAGGGLLVGAMVGSVLSPTPLSVQGNWLSFTAVSGAVTAAYFWLIRRPDLDEPNPVTTTP
jgi:hypothetical protein